MMRKLALLLLLLLLVSAPAGMASSSGFLLGIDSSGVSPYGNLIATDNSGASYFANTDDVICGTTAGPCVTKVAADGKTVVWQILADVWVAVDPNGGVYFGDPGTAGLLNVEKLSADGTGIAWTVPVAEGQGSCVGFTVDSAGRVYAAISQPSQATVVRVKADGSGLDYTAQLPGSPKLLVADGAGSAIAALDVPQQGAGNSYVLTRLSADGSSPIYSIPIGVPTAMAADPAGDVALVVNNPIAARARSFSILQRFDPQGVQTLSQALPGVLPVDFMGTINVAPPNVAMDAAGNMYVAAAFLAHSVKNSVASCGSAGVPGASLLVYGPDGALIEGTYLPGSNFPNPPLAYVVVGPGPVVSVTSGDGTLTRLSQNGAAQVLPLACVANAAGYTNGAIAPGEIVALFGNRLGPQQGIVTTASMESPFPTQAGGVEVTFDGTPAPLLWVQDGQINAVVPWGLTPGGNTSVCVSNNSAETNCLTQPVSQTAPGVFTADGYYALALNEDGTVNSAANPARLNSEIVIYATGLGPIEPAQADGSLVGLPLPVNVFAANVFLFMWELIDKSQVAGLTIDYVGPAPYELAGVTQINAHLTGTIVPPAPFGLGMSPVDGGTVGSGSNGFGIYVTAP